MRTARGGATCVGLLVSAALVVASASSDPPPASRAHSLEDATEAQAKEFGDTFHWQEQGPLDFIVFLKRRSSQPEGSRSLFYTVHGRHTGWLHDTDVPDLIALVDSKEPCPHVVMSRSSYLPRAHSFVGQEALFLIEGYRRGEYPPGPCSSGFYKKKDEVLAWWRERAARR